MSTRTPIHLAAGAAAIALGLGLSAQAVSAEEW